MKTKLIICITILALIMTGVIYQCLIPPCCHGQIVIHCFDDTGKPMPGARITVHGTCYYDRGYNDNVFSGVSDQNGNVNVDFSVKAKTDNLYIKVESMPLGYHYTFSCLHYKRNGKKWMSNCLEQNFYFRREIEPVPMYAKKVDVILPALETAIGYDLLVGDLVKPYGNGTISDLLISLKKSWKTKEDYATELTISFPNQGDGIAPIKMLGIEWLWVGLDSKNPVPRTNKPIPWEAAGDGYLSKFTQREQVSGKNITFERIPKKNSYLSCRIRTKYDMSGKMTSGMYGLFGGPFLCDLNSSTARIVFRYAVNPNGSRIIEFHSSKNLFKDLKPEEQYRSPY